jgi:hypothetical protein
MQKNLRIDMKFAFLIIVLIALLSARMDSAVRSQTETTQVTPALDTASEHAIGVSVVSPLVFARNKRDISVNRSKVIGPASVIENYIGVQGEPFNAGDPFEANAWKSVGMRTDSFPLIDDAGIFNNRGIEVFRGEAPETGNVRGPFGPNNDLWIRTDNFDSSIASYRKDLGMKDSQIQLAIAVMPKVLSYMPESPNYSVMSPASREEWTATIVKIAKYLKEIGWSHWSFSLMGEPESGFYGENQSPTTPGIEDSYAKLWIDTERAFDSVHPGTRIFAVANGVYSSELLAKLRGNPGEIGVDHYISALRRADPDFQPKAIAVQGYFWLGSKGYGAERLLFAADYIRSVLEANGFNPDIPISLEGFNGTFGNPESSVSPKQRKNVGKFGQSALDREAAFSLSSLLDFIRVGKRGFAYTYYYTWNLDYNLDCGVAAGDDAPFPYQSIISTKRPKTDSGLGDGCYYPASELDCGRATYQMFVLLSRMKQGSIVSSSIEARSESDVSVLATANGRNTQVIIANRYGKELKSRKLNILGANPGKSYRITTSEIVSEPNLCARILTKERKSVVAARDGSLTIDIPSTKRSILHFSFGEL